MSFYIEHPKVIRAVQFGERDFVEWTQWLQKDYNEKNWVYRFDPLTGLANGFAISLSITGGGPGDYLVKDINGDLEAYSKEFFEKNYEKIEVKESGRDERT